jgi:hypothetical protein
MIGAVVNNELERRGRRPQEIDICYEGTEELIKSMEASPS